jgi:hypothetical protein
VEKALAAPMRRQRRRSAKLFKCLWDFGCLVAIKNTEGWRSDDGLGDFYCRKVRQMSSYSVVNGWSFGSGGVCGLLLIFCLMSWIFVGGDESRKDIPVMS